MVRAGLALSLLCGIAAATPPEEPRLARARDHSEAGQGLFRVGDYQGAAREFAAGYALVPKPEFLINLGQTYRRLGEVARARQMFERFLEAAPDDHPSRRTVSQILLDMKPAPSLSVAAPLATTTVAVAPVAPRATADVAAAPPRSRRVVWVAIVAAVIVAVGAAVATALALTLRGPTPSGGTLTFVR